MVGLRALVGIEVKAGAGGKIRSLQQWMQDIRYRKKRAVRFNMSKGAVEDLIVTKQGKALQFQLLSLPLYLIDRWQNLVFD